MEIQFTNINNLWVAEFEVTSDFNLHLERDTEGRLDIYQRTAGGDYEYIYDIGYLNKRTVYDNDFQALVYPKWIKIKSAVKPLIATITTDGEVNEVVYQAKDIEITSNGTTKVTADTGYTALGSVNVKVNVPSEGGGGSTPTELKRNDVNFFDYDGTLLYSYSYEEACDLTELPPAPSHDGLEFKEWNYDLQDIKDQGGIYVVVDGICCHDYGTVEMGDRFRIFMYNASYDQYMVILFKDEPSVGSIGSLYSLSTYNITNDGKITADVLSPLDEEVEVEDLGFFKGKANVGAVFTKDGEVYYHYGVCILPKDNDDNGWLHLPTWEDRSSVAREYGQGDVIKEVSIPTTYYQIGVGSGYANGEGLYNRVYLNEVVLPHSVYEISEYYGALNNSEFLNSFYFNKKSRIGHPWYGSEFIGLIDIPEGVSIIDSSFDDNDCNLKVVMPESLTVFNSSSSHGRIIYDFSKATSIPILNNNGSEDYLGYFIVPDNLYDEWKQATNWASLRWNTIEKSSVFYKNIR